MLFYQVKDDFLNVVEPSRAKATRIKIGTVCHEVQVSGLIPVILNKPFRVLS